MKKALYLYYSYEENFNYLEDAELGQLIRALIKYDRDGIETTFKDRLLNSTFCTIKGNLDRKKENYAEESNRRKAAGRKGGLAKARNAKKILANLADKEKEKEKVKGTVKEKGKEKDKEKHPFGDFVTLTHTQHQNLLDKHGETKTTALIQVLENYKASHGKQYKSDYHAIIGWVTKKYNEEEAERAAKTTAALRPTKSHNYTTTPGRFDHEKLAALERERLEKRILAERLDA